MRTTTEIKAVGLTFAPAAVDPEAAKRDAREKGKNHHSLDLAPLGPFLLANYRTFSLSDFIKASSSLDIEYCEREAYFAAFVKQAIKEGRIKEIQSCYSEPVFRVL